MDVHVGEFRKYLHKQITEDLHKIEAESTEKKFNDVKSMIDIRQKEIMPADDQLQNDGTVHILYSQRQNSKKYESNASDTLGEAESSLPS